jgi:RNA polymerase sigma-70 factor (ECF subfamily)
MVRTVTLPGRRRRVNSERLLTTFADARADLLSLLAQHLGSQDDALDALQDTFVKCWRRRDRLHEVRNLRAWIFRVGLNTARDFQRNVWRRRSRPLEMPLFLADRPANSPSEQLLHREALERLRLALVDLRPEEREVFLLRQNSDLTYDEIALRRCTPVGTIKTQMRTALLKLRGVLQDREPAASSLDTAIPF